MFGMEQKKCLTNCSDEKNFERFRFLFPTLKILETRMPYSLANFSGFLGLMKGLFFQKVYFIPKYAQNIEVSGSFFNFQRPEKA